MLPILRMTSVGVALLAVAILVVALRPQNTAHARWPATLGPARGALIAQADHPEWRQFLRLAAVQRADEIQRLRALPDTPVKGNDAKPATTFIGFPVDRGNAEPDDPTGSIPTPAGSTLPMEIGKPSSAELPVAKHEETQPAITPALVKQRHESRVRHRKSRATAKPKADTKTSYAADDRYQARAGTLNP